MHVPRRLYMEPSFLKQIHTSCCVLLSILYVYSMAETPSSSNNKRYRIQ
ncbi:hypothetical protein OIU77_007803 [Salix suchowensis]|uniref:Uncharacterized protein n=1 Tax=Salix suchowensis TaxID=1278906 RepID=A0ABQ9AHE5_9ROSI|nr:hypothetical protein OIU77_007803 [Salix suchowensis]